MGLSSSFVVTFVVPISMSSIVSRLSCSALSAIVKNNVAASLKSGCSRSSLLHAERVSFTFQLVFQIAMAENCQKSKLKTWGHKLFAKASLPDCSASTSRLMAIICSTMGASRMFSRFSYRTGISRALRNGTIGSRYLCFGARIAISLAGVPSAMSAAIFWLIQSKLAISLWNSCLASVALLGSVELAALSVLFRCSK